MRHAAMLTQDLLAHVEVSNSGSTLKHSDKLKINRHCGSELPQQLSPLAAHIGFNIDRTIEHRAKGKHHGRHDCIDNFNNPEPFHQIVSKPQFLCAAPCCRHKLL